MLEMTSTLFYVILVAAPIMSGFEVIDGRLQEPCPPVTKKQQQQQKIKKAGLKLIVKRHRLSRVVVTCYSVFTIATF